jgi:hypothetical protein
MLRTPVRVSTKGEPVTPEQVCVIIIGVVSVVSKYNCVYYCDTCEGQHQGGAGHIRAGRSFYLYSLDQIWTYMTCVCMYVCMYLCNMYIQLYLLTSHISFNAYYYVTGQDPGQTGAQDHQLQGKYRRF